MNAWMIKAAIVLLLLLTAASDCRATAYPQPRDFEAVSPNGAYRLIADYPEGWRSARRAKEQVSFQLIETNTGTVRWQHQGDEDALFGMGLGLIYDAYIDDQGNTLAKGGPGRTYLVPISAKDGTIGDGVGFQFSEYRQLDSDRYFESFFSPVAKALREPIRIDGEAHLLFRLIHGEWMLCRFRDAAIIQELSPRQRRACRIHERQLLLDVLEKTPEQIELITRRLFPLDQRNPHESSLSPDQHQESMLNMRLRELRAAMQIAGRFGFQEAIPALREIESWNPEVPAQQDAIDANHRDLFEVRYQLWREACVTLRRLGQLPSGDRLDHYWLPNSVVTRMGARGPWEQRIDLSPTAPFPAIDPAAITKGMPIDVVIKLLGPPDEEYPTEGKDHRFEFDIDSNDPYTLRIDFERVDEPETPARVSRIVRIHPARWTVHGHRDIEIELPF